MATLDNVKVFYSEDGTVDFEATHGELDRLLGKLVAESVQTEEKIRESIMGLFAANPTAGRNIEAIVMGVCRALNVDDDDLPTYRKTVTKWVETHSDKEGENTGKPFSFVRKPTGRPGTPPKVYYLRSQPSQATQEHAPASNAAE